MPRPHFTMDKMHFLMMTLQTQMRSASAFQSAARDMAPLSRYAVVDRIGELGSIPPEEVFVWGVL
jgi:hypothetical protein